MELLVNDNLYKVNIKKDGEILWVKSIGLWLLF